MTTTPTFPDTPLRRPESRRYLTGPSVSAAMRHPRVRLAIVGALVAIAGAGVWLATGGGGSSAPGTHTAATGATTVSEQSLVSASARLGRAVYWTGPEPGKSLELTALPDGRVYVRYLPAGVAAGADAPYLTVGTYPIANAYAATAAAARKKGSVRIPVSGGVGFYSTSRPTSVYVAFRGSRYQVEVYSPTAAKARSVVEHSRLAPVAGSRTSQAPTSPGRAASATASDLSALSARLGHAVYWAGTKRGTSLELTDLSDGRVFVRYLPAGVQVGAPSPYLTVATYPMKGAYARTAAAASRRGSVRIPVPDAIAFTSRVRPTSVYLAFKGSDVQVEVYDPSPATLRALVAAGKIAPAS